MRKQVKTLIIVGAVIVVLALATGALFLFGSDGGGESSSPASQHELAATFVDKTSDDVQSVTVKNEKGEFTAQRGEDTLAISLLDGLTTNNTELENLAVAASGFYAERLIEENPSRPADFGLDPAAAQVSVTYTDGSTFSIELGSASASGGRYARIPGETKVYLLTETTDSFFYGVNNFVSNVIFDAGLTEEQKDEAVLLKAELGGTLHPTPIVIEKNPFKNVETHPAGYVDKAITSPYFAGASVSVDNAFPSSLSKILASSVAAVVTDPSELAQYGLDQPYSTLSFSFQSGEQTYSGSLWIGSKNDEGNYYATTADKRVVYVVKADNVSYMELTDRQLLYPIPVLINIQLLSSYDIDASQVTAKFEPVVTEENGSKAVTGGVANGNGVSADCIKKLYESLGKLSADEITDREPSGERLMTVTYRFSDGSTAPITVDYYYDTARTVLVKVNGLENAPNYVMQRKTIDSFLNKTQKALNGEVVVPSATD